MGYFSHCLQCALLAACLLALVLPASAQNDRALHFRGDHDYPPYEFVDKNGNPTGFNVELLQKTCGVMGLDCRVTLGPWNEVRAQLENGTIDGITGMFYSGERDRKVDFSTHHSIVSHSIFVPTASSITGIDDLIDKSIGVQQGDIMHDYLLQNGLSAFVFGYAEQEEVLESLVSNGVDCALIARIQGLYVMKKLGIDNVEPVGQSILPRKYCFAVRQGDDVLRSQLNEGLSILKKNGEYAAIHDHWFSPYTREQIRKKVFTVLAWILVPIGVIFVLGFLWTYFLKRQVREKTQILHKELKERKRVEKALVESEGNYRRVFNNAATCMILLDGEGRVVMANRKCLQSFGYEQEDMLLGMHLTALVSDPGLGEIVRTCLGGEEEHFERESKIRAFGGEIKDVVISIGTIPNKERRIVSFLDVSPIKEAERERKGLERELAHARKMEAVGTLAGGIAHDFNNLLQTISGNLYFLSKKTGKGSGLERYLRDTEYSVNRARDLVRHLMTFSRKMEPRMEIVDVHGIIHRGLSLLQRTVPKMVVLETKFTEDRCLIKADPGQIEQVLLNLVQNAADALVGDGRVGIETELIHVEKPRPMAGTELEPGHYVCIRVRDDGHGMSSGVVEHIFEPFFTTKEVGKGTGLGLSSVYGIVKAHHGYVECKSRVGQGTTMSMYFPSDSHLEPEKEIDEPETIPDENTLPAGSTILLVDDEEMIRELTREFLEENGHTVLTAASGEEALQVHAEERSRIDLVIIDLGMPGMGGEACIRKMLDKYPETRILVASGYSAHPMSKDPPAHGVIGFVGKPYKFDELTTLVRKLTGNKDGKGGQNG
ncbi:transporter substrate-binding domain-containing protein [Desulfoplanes sp.]